MTGNLCGRPGPVAGRAAHRPPSHRLASAPGQKGPSISYMEGPFTLPEAARIEEISSFLGECRCGDFEHFKIGKILRVFATRWLGYGATLAVTVRARRGVTSGDSGRRGRRSGVRTEAANHMGLMIEQGGAADEYEAVALPVRSESSAIFVRRSNRPSRRAVLHLRELTASLAPTDLVRWYNERGFHFYLTDVGTIDNNASGRNKQTRSQPSAFAALDAVCGHLREADGI